MAEFAVLTGKAPRHADPSPICRPAKGSRWEFIVAYMDLLSTVPRPPEWMSAETTGIPAEMAVWGTTFRYRAIREKDRIEVLLRNAGVPETSLVEPYPEGVEKLFDHLRAGHALALAAQDFQIASQPQKRKRKISHCTTMLIGIACLFHREKGTTDNAMYVATAAYLNEGLRRGSATAGLDRNAIRREFVKFRRITKGPIGHFQFDEALRFYDRLIRIEAKARRHPQLRGLSGAALVSAIEKRGHAVSGFLKHIILPTQPLRVS